MGVMSGRLSEIETQEREELDFVQREIAYKVDQVNSAYGAIKMMMDVMGMDFQNGMAEYNAKFNQKIAIYDQFRAVKREELDELHRNQEFARVNLEIYIDAIKSGNMTYNNLDEATKLKIAKLEIQSGLGQGFMNNLHMKPGEDIHSIVTRDDGYGNTYADILRVGTNGEITVESKLISSGNKVSTSGTSKATQAETKASTLSKIQSWIDSKGSNLTMSDYEQARQDWLIAGYSASQFDSAFGKYKTQIAKGTGAGAFQNAADRIKKALSWNK